MHPTLSDMMADIVQNSFEAGASNVTLSVVERGGRMEVEVLDDGCGMDAETLAGAMDPFRTAAGKHPGRRVGLGLPFLKLAVEQCGGRVEVESAPGKGTRVRFGYDAGHVDAPPMGDFAGMATGLMNYPGAREVRVVRKRGGKGYEVTRGELAEAAGDLSTAEGLGLAKAFFSSNEEELAESEEVQSWRN